MTREPGNTWYSEVRVLDAWRPQLTKFDPLQHSAYKRSSRGADGRVKIRNIHKVPDSLSITQSRMWLAQADKLEAVE